MRPDVSILHTYVREIQTCKSPFQKALTFLKESLLTSISCCKNFKSTLTGILSSELEA